MVDEGGRWMYTVDERWVEGLGTKSQGMAG